MRPSLALLVLAGCTSWETSERTERFDPSTFSRLDVQLQRGSVEVRTGSDAGLVAATISWRGDVPPQVSARVASETLLLTGQCAFDDPRCEIAVVVEAPPNLDVDVLQEDGSILLDGIQGIADLVLEQGSVEVSYFAGAVRIDTDGDVALHSLTGRVDVFSRGTVTGTDLAVETLQVVGDREAIYLDMINSPSLVQAKTEAGPIQLTLPYGEYDITATSRRGTASVEGLESVSNAESVVVVSSASGDVTIAAQ